MVHTTDLQRTAEVFHVGPPEDPDRYRLGAAVGAGREGILYHGYLTVAPELGLDVAVKLLHPQHDPRLEAGRRQWRERVGLLRSLRAPGVVGVRDGFVGALPHPARAGGHGEALYLVMNYVDGMPLDVWAEENAGLSDRNKLRLLLPVAAGLDLLHTGAATGGVPLVHGDVKPANVLVTAEGHAVLVGFGMARPVAGDSSSPADDRYAFGGVAYHLLTGGRLTEGRPDLDLTTMRAGLQQGVSLVTWCAQQRDSGLAADWPPIVRRPAPVARRLRKAVVNAGVAGLALMLVGLAAVLARNGDGSNPRPAVPTSSVPGTGQTPPPRTTTAGAR